MQSTGQDVHYSCRSVLQRDKHRQQQWCHRATLATVRATSARQRACGPRPERCLNAVDRTPDSCSAVAG